MILRYAVIYFLKIKADNNFFIGILSESAFKKVILENMRQHQENLRVDA